MKTIPGAEFAPLVNVSLDLSAFRVLQRYVQEGPERALATSPDQRDQLDRWTTRRLSVEDPDDRRAIWRRAALALGDPRHASSARFAWQWTSGIGHRWCLIVGDFDAALIWEGAQDIKKIEEATAALCRAVWGERTS